MGQITAARRTAIFGQPGHVDKIAVMTPWGVPTQCHVLIAPLFTQACEAAFHIPWDPQRIDSYNPRPIRGEDGDELDEWSLHAWCLGWDFFATPPNMPPPGGVWTPDNGVPEAFARCFTDRGFRWGGDWNRRRDVPHIEWADGLPPDLEDDMPLTDADILKIAAAVKQVLEPEFDKTYQKIVPNETVREDIRLTRDIAKAVGVPGT